MFPLCFLPSGWRWFRFCPIRQIRLLNTCYAQKRQTRQHNLADEHDFQRRGVCVDGNCLVLWTELVDVTGRMPDFVDDLGVEYSVSGS